MPTLQWEERLALVWSELTEENESECVAAIDSLTGELTEADAAIAAFERGGAQDSIGNSDVAVPFYREALALGLAPDRRRRACIQLASSLRNLGHAQESVAILTAELAEGSDDLDDAVNAFLALALVDAGRDREAVSVALGALAKHLTRYQRSLTNYAADLAAQPPNVA